MISQERINEQIEKEYNFYTNHGCYFSMVDFSNGVKFAIEELKPMFVEFADFIGKESVTYDYYSVNDDYFWTYDEHSSKTTEELFELFLKEREDGHTDV